MRKLLSALLIAIAGTTSLFTSFANAQDFDIRGQGTIVHVSDGDTFVIKADAQAPFLALKKEALQRQSDYQRDLNV